LELLNKIFSLFNVLDTAVSLLLSDRGGEQGTSSKLGGERVYIGIDPKKLDNLTKTVSDIVGEGLFK